MSNFRILTVFSVFLSTTLFAQYNPENHVVTVSSYDLRYLSDVEEGSSEERQELFETYFKKMNESSDLLISNLVLGHYFGGSSNQVKQMAEWKSLADADAWLVSGVDRRKKAWPDEEERKAFLDNYNKYWVGNHTDLAVRELVASRVKRYNKGADENTIVSVQTRNLKPMSEVEEGFSEEREKLLDDFFEKAVSAHVSKWHGEGQWNQFGSKVMSGPRSGQYFIGTTNHYWKDYDERKTSDSHDKDWERIINTYVEENSGMRYYVKVPDASYNDRRSPMFLLTYYNLSPAAVGKKLDLIRKAKEAAEKTKYERSWGVYQVRGANRVLAIAFRMDGMVDMGPGKMSAFEMWKKTFGEETASEMADTWYSTHWSSEEEIHVLIESMTTPPTN